MFRNHRYYLSQRMWKCTYQDCGKSLSSEGRLSQHIKTVHLQTKDYQCQHCDKRFAQQNTLKDHVNAIHLKVKPYKCDAEDCQYKCSSKTNLAKHVKQVHLDIRPFICTIDGCTKSYKRKYHLEGHIASAHLKDRLFPCTVEGCNMSFTTDEYMKRHKKRVHDKVKPYSCTENGCNISFFYPSDLKVHTQVVHLKLQPYACEWPGCTKKFSEKGHRKTHLLEVHIKKKDYFCPECGTGFYSSQSVGRHKMIYHGKCLSQGCPSRPCRLFGYKHCFHCGHYINGTTPSMKRQAEVFEWIGLQLEDIHDEDFQIIYDSKDPVNGRCTESRADIRIILPYRTIIVEVDEEQHGHSLYSCLKAHISDVLGEESVKLTKRDRTKMKEDARMSDLASSGDITQIVFIRFNPDSWVNENNVEEKKMKHVPEHRLIELLEEIKKWMDIEKEQEHIAEVVYLYYNGPKRQRDFIPMDPTELEPKNKDYESSEEEMEIESETSSDEEYDFDLGDISKDNKRQKVG